MSGRSQDSKTYRIVFVGVMAAIVFVITYLRVPFLGSKLSVGNAFCLLSGLLFGPVAGGLAAGFGSFLYDMVGGYDVGQALITFVSKFAMAYICALIAQTYIKGKEENNVRIIVGSVIGALSYVALYMLKSFIFGLTVDGLTMDGTMLKLASKLPASLINAAAAIVIAPILYKAIAPTLRRMGALDKIR